MSLRTPTDAERQFLDRLLEIDFPGRNDLLDIMADLQVRTLDENGSLGLVCSSPLEARVVKTVPVEAEVTDEDGYTIHILLHMLKGRPYELEIYKDDGSDVKKAPHPSSLELIVLPPEPRE